MASNSDQAGELPEPLVERALAFAFGLGEHPWYTAERTALGVPVVYRVLSTLEAEACDEAADALDSPAAREKERWVQWLARGVVSVDGNDLPEGLTWRLSHFHAMPEPAMQRVVEQFVAVTREYARLLGPESIKN